jgi:hypothetical protein
MDYTQLTTNVPRELMRFVNDHTSALDESRIEIRKNSNGQLMAELLTNEPEPRCA